MPAKLPACSFTIDTKRYPDVPNIIKFIDKTYGGGGGIYSSKNGNHSKAMCRFITESYRIIKHQMNYLDRLSGYDPDKDAEEDKAPLLFELTLPRMNAPHSEIRFEDNYEMYRFMTIELLDHIERNAHLILDAIAKAKQHFKIPFDPTILSTLVELKEISNSFKDKYQNQQPFPNEEAEAQAFEQFYNDRINEEYQKYYTYIEKQANKVLRKTAKQSIAERRAELQAEIAQKQDELRHLTHLQEHEKHESKQASVQEENQIDNEISQS